MGTSNRRRQNKTPADGQATAAVAKMHSSIQGETMLVCPYDMHWCDRTGCKSACELSGEKPLLQCVSCGVLIIRPVAHGLCVDCITVHFAEQEKG